MKIMKGRALVSLSLALAATAIGQSLLFVMVPVIGETIRMGFGDLSLIITVGIVAFVLAAPVWGRISDLKGRRRVMLYGCAGVVIGHGGFALGIEVGARALVEPDLTFCLLILSRLIYGTFAAALFPIAQAWVADLYAEPELMSKFGALRLAMTIGRFAGPPVAAGLMFLAPLAPIYFLVLFALGALVAVWSCREPPRPAGQGVADRARTAREISEAASSPVLAFSFLLAVVVLLSLTVGQLQFTIGLHAQTRLGLDAVHASQFVGLLLTAAALAAVAVQVFVIRRLRAHAYAALSGSAVIVSFAVALVFWGETRLLFLSGAVLAGAAVAVALPACTVIGTAGEKRQRLGRSMGAVGSAQTVGYAIGAALGGLYSIDPAASYGLAIIAPLLALIIVVVPRRVRQPG